MPAKPTYSDKEIIAAIQSGGLKARKMMEYVYKAHRGLVHMGIRKHRISLEDSRDVYADAIVTLSRHITLGKFREDSAIGTYLYAIFYNKCRNRVRDNQRKYAEWVDEMPEMPEKARGIMAEIIEKEELAWLEKYMAQLGENCRQILWDKEFWGYSMDEIAKRLGYDSARSVAVRKAKCLKKLREILAKARKDWNDRITSAKNGD